MTTKLFFVLDNKKKITKKVLTSTETIVNLGGFAFWKGTNPLESLYIL